MNLTENSTDGATLVEAESGKTQRARILRLLLEAHGAWIPLPAILELGIAQYNARILELRRLGLTIENKTEWVDGVRRSWFRLTSPAHRTPDPSPPFELVP